MKALPLFSVRLAAGWLAAAALTFAFSFYFMTLGGGSGHEADDSGPTIYSNSALGYATFYHMLPRLGIPVGDNISASGPPADAAVVVIAEPYADAGTLARVRNELRRAPAVLLVLPKRTGEADPRRRDRLRDDALLPLHHAKDVLALADTSATLDRHGAMALWDVRAPIAGAPRLAGPQLAHSTRMRPLVQSAAGILVGEIPDNERRVVVVTDPDIFENHGIARGDNALVAASIVRSLRGARRGRVVFDETAHGIVARPFSAMRLLFGFPFVLVTVQVVLATALLLWSGGVRFGAPRPREATLPLGKRGLIESGSRLLEYAAQLSFLIERYAEAVLRETAQAVNAPRGLARDELIAWFARTGRAVPDATSPADAEAMYRWRDAVLDESGQRTQRR
ncbi:MAG: hypothetical protein M3169_11050 [Candidatus Eremiobacteraeota bacterium]|nr:hypothetical protein [Candidatus Eremiobacteraeota bacterium]